MGLGSVLPPGFISAGIKSVVKALNFCISGRNPFEALIVRYSVHPCEIVH